MKRFALILLVLTLTGCATERPYSGYGSEGSSYYRSGVGSSLRFAPGYDSLFLYGVYPWWTYDFYSPYFYPYRFTYYHPFYDPFWNPWPFAGWYPVWPYGGGYAWRSALYRPWPAYPSGPRHPVDPEDPVASHPTPPAGVVIGDGERRRYLEERSLARERLYRGYDSWQGPVSGSSKIMPAKPGTVTTRPKTFLPPTTSRSPGSFAPAPRSGKPAGLRSAPVAPVRSGQPAVEGGRIHRER
jgi:hypothetical protein